MLIEPKIKESGLENVCRKIQQEERLSFEDGIKLYNSNDLLSLGYMANMIRERKNDNRVYFVRNQHINYTNICGNQCKFCAFSKDRDNPGAYEMSIKDIREKIKETLSQPISEIHIVGGLNPGFPYSYYPDMLQAIKKIRPEVHLKAFTMVEIAFIAKIGNKSVKNTLKDLKEAGLESLPGGGAEVFSPRIRQELCPRKLSPEGWLKTAQTANKLGIRNNANKLYGHLEKKEELVEHLIELRKVQDESRGFLAFIPLAFHPQNTRLDYLKGTTGFEDLKNVAISRMMLDNFPHIKAYWVMLTPKVAQLALGFGADDIDGTIVEEKITHSAGAQTARSLTQRELITLIKKAGKSPVERDSLYNILREY